MEDIKENESKENESKENQSLEEINDDTIEENKNEEEIDEIEEIETLNHTQLDENTIREEEIEFRIAEINVIIDEYQNKLYDEEIETMSRDEYNALLEEEKKLKAELKSLRKVTRNSFWDKVKIWHLIYGAAQLVICMPYIGLIYRLCMLVYSKLYEWFGDSFATLDPNFAFFLEVLMILAFPIINIFISWILYANVVSKKRLDQIVFLSIWGGQILLTIISMLFVFIG